MASILGFAGYVPRYRIRAQEIGLAWSSPGRGDGERAVPALDETVLSMARAAAEPALRRARVGAARLRSVHLCTLSGPYAERSLATSLAFGLGAVPTALPFDHGLSPRAPALALLSCANSAAGTDLVVGVDALRGAPGSPLEASAGAAGGALVLGPGPGAAKLEGAHSHATDFAERWRPADARYPRQADERFARGRGYLDHVTVAVRGLLEKLGRRPEEYAHVVLQSPSPRWGSDALRALGFRKEQLRDLFGSVGDAGCGSLPLSIASVLEVARPGERLLAVSYGSGGSDALSFEAEPGVEEARDGGPTVERMLQEKEYVDYVTYLRHQRVLRKGEE